MTSGHRQVIEQHGVGQGLNVLEEGDLEAEARGVADAHHPAELADDGVFILPGDHQGADRADEDHQDQHDNDNITNYFSMVHPPQLPKLNIFRLFPFSSVRITFRPGSSSSMAS